MKNCKDACNVGDEAVLGCFSHASSHVLNADIVAICSHSGWFRAFSSGQQRGRTGIDSPAQACEFECIEALDVLMDAIEKSGHKDKVQCCFRCFVCNSYAWCWQVKIGTDVAASEFYKDTTSEAGLLLGKSVRASHAFL